VDIDQELAEWCQKKLPFADFRMIQPLPPLPFAAGTFDLIMGYSVLTHLDEQDQFSWLEELHRIASHGATIILTIHGEWVSRHLHAEEMRVLDEKGFYFRVRDTGRWKKDGLPDFYQDTYHRKDYVLENFSKFFHIEKYVERGFNDKQDLVLMVKKDR